MAKFLTVILVCKAAVTTHRIIWKEVEDRPEMRHFTGDLNPSPTVDEGVLGYHPKSPNRG